MTPARAARSVRAERVRADWISPARRRRVESDGYERRSRGGSPPRERSRDEALDERSASLRLRRTAFCGATRAGARAGGADAAAAAAALGPRRSLDAGALVPLLRGGARRATATTRRRDSWKTAASRLDDSFVSQEMEESAEGVSLALADAAARAVADADAALARAGARLGAEEGSGSWATTPPPRRIPPPPPPRRSRRATRGRRGRAALDGVAGRLPLRTTKRRLKRRRRRREKEKAKPPRSRCAAAARRRLRRGGRARLCREGAGAKRTARRWLAAPRRGARRRARRWTRTQRLFRRRDRATGSARSRVCARRSGTKRSRRSLPRRSSRRAARRRARPELVAPERRARRARGARARGGAALAPLEAHWRPGARSARSRSRASEGGAFVRARPRARRAFAPRASLREGNRSRDFERPATRNDDEWKERSAVAPAPARARRATVAPSGRARRLGRARRVRDRAMSPVCVTSACARVVRNRRRRFESTRDESLLRRRLERRLERRRVRVFGSERRVGIGRGGRDAKEKKFPRRVSVRARVPRALRPRGGVRGVPASAR